MRYKTAFDFRRALSDRLNHEAKQTGTDVNRLQKRLAFERFLARLFGAGAGRWVLKGGYALDLRLSDRARTTLDVDLGMLPPPLDDLLDDLQSAAEADLGDYFEFRVRRSGELSGPPLGGSRFLVEALLGGTRFDTFRLDVGQGDPVVTETEWISGQIDLSFAGVPTPRFVVLPLAAHFADKLHAYTRPRETPTRVKDLADLLLLLDLGLGATTALRRLVETTFELYATHSLLETLPRPPASWERPYAAMALELRIGQRTLADAYERLQGFYRELFR
jgi:hypothetical protein